MADYAPACMKNDAGCMGAFADSSFNIAFDDRSQAYPVKFSTNRRVNHFFAGVLGMSSISTGNEVLEDPGITAYGFTWFLLDCDITIYDITYTWVIDSVLTSNTFTQLAYNVQLAALIRFTVRFTEPSRTSFSSQEPYILPTSASWRILSAKTSSLGPYRM